MYCTCIIVVPRKCNVPPVLYSNGCFINGHPMCGKEQAYVPGRIRKSDWNDPAAELVTIHPRRPLLLDLAPLL